MLAFTNAIRVGSAILTVYGGMIELDKEPEDADQKEKAEMSGEHTGGEKSEMFEKAGEAGNIKKVKEAQESIDSRDVRESRESRDGGGS